ncbi:hypothetical protein QLX08_006937 [Tetragonisca angustula]|uniref:Uncharacterized protein n=1 Tax=Tetragonisca angustula TaxID=166442 RepID=A0AAW0ZSA4_9HYME
MMVSAINLWNPGRSIVAKTVPIPSRNFKSDNVGPEEDSFANVRVYDTGTKLIFTRGRARALLTDLLLMSLDFSSSYSE